MIRVDVDNDVEVEVFFVKMSGFFLLIVDVGNGGCYCFYDV